MMNVREVKNLFGSEIHKSNNFNKISFLSIGFLVVSTSHEPRRPTREIVLIFLFFRPTYRWRPFDLRIVSTSNCIAHVRNILVSENNFISSKISVRLTHNVGVDCVLLQKTFSAGGGLPRIHSTWSSKSYAPKIAGMSPYDKVQPSKGNHRVRNFLHQRLWMSPSSVRRKLNKVKIHFRQIV